MEDLTEQIVRGVSLIFQSERAARSLSPAVSGLVRSSGVSPEKGWPRQEPSNRNSSVQPCLISNAFYRAGSDGLSPGALTPASPAQEQLHLPSGAAHSLTSRCLSEKSHIKSMVIKNLKYELHLQQLPSILNNQFKVWEVGFFKF